MKVGCLGPAWAMTDEHEMRLMYGMTKATLAIFE